MMKITFSNDEVVKDYIDGLLDSGMHTVSSTENLKIGAFCVIGNDIYFVM